MCLFVCECVDVSIRISAFVNVLDAYSFTCICTCLSEYTLTCIAVDLDGYIENMTEVKHL